LAESLFEEMKRFVRFDADDQRRLGALGPHAAPCLPGIADAFYSRLAEHDQARGLFSGPEQVDRLKRTLRGWMATTLCGPWDQAYFEARARIGSVHVRIGVPPRYVCAAMNLVRRALARIASEAFASHPATLLGVNEALEKVLDLDLAIILESYAEVQVQRVKDLEERRLVALRTLTAGLAHEIRNPLNAAHLQLVVARNRLAEPTPEVPAALAAVGVADLELQRLAALVGEFLSFATPRPLQRASHDLRELIREAVASLGAWSERARTEVVLLPGPTASISVDGEKLSEVVRNLVRNACEASGAGGRVDVGVTVDLDTVRLDVSDDGPGLPSPTHRVFEPFFTTKDQGTGLGLSVVQRIVSDHGGDVTAARRDGRTVFTVRLPR
jgi:two-component system, NtrC family, sensor histidine kinase HydH